MFLFRIVIGDKNEIVMRIPRVCHGFVHVNVKIGYSWRDYALCLVESSLFTTSLAVASGCRDDSYSNFLKNSCGRNKLINIGIIVQTWQLAIHWPLQQLVLVSRELPRDFSTPPTLLSVFSSRTFNNTWWFRARAPSPANRHRRRDNN